MDKQQNFIGWDETVKKWVSKKNLVTEIKSSYPETKSEPSMYKIWIIYDEEIPNTLYLNIFSKIFNAPVRKLISLIKTLKTKKQAFWGEYTYEACECKMSAFTKYTNKTGFTVKFIMSKDNEYVIKKS